AGKITRHMILLRDKPNVLAVWMSTPSIFLTPSMVFKRIGQAQEKTITKIFISSSKPKNNMATGTITGGGIGRSISMMTSSPRWKALNSPMSKPNGIKMAAARKYPTRDLFRLVKICQGIWPDSTREKKELKILLNGGTMSGFTHPA